jgi:hypothetical protein
MSRRPDASAQHLFCLARCTACNLLLTAISDDAVVDLWTKRKTCARQVPKTRVAFQVWC